MNEDLVERFRRAKMADRKAPNKAQAEVWILPQKLNAKVRQYFDYVAKPADAGPWLDRSEVPASAEILDVDGDGDGNSDVLEIVPNKVTGSWESKGEYSQPQHVFHLLTP